MATILIADDDPLLRRMLAEALSATGARVMEAANGEEAIHIAMSSKLDIALLDLVMPNVDGLEAIRTLRIECPDLKIVALSGGGRNRNLDILSLAGRMGADACLAKPFTPRQLMQLLATKFGIGLARPTISQPTRT
jgi:two-component system response regulator CpxR